MPGGMRLFARRHAALFLAVAASFLAGCGRAPAPEFTPSEATQELVPEARDGMTIKDEEGESKELPGILETVEAHFGTLAEPKAWPILPIHFGGTDATVIEVLSPTEEEAEAALDEDRPFNSMTVRVEPVEGEKFGPIPNGSAGGWKEGVYEGKLVEVTSFNPETGELVLEGTFDDGLPEPDDLLSLNPGEMFAEGQALYNRHCIHCHGAGGAGDGPTARYLEPKPRDFRLGRFKFTSTAQTDKISRADLRRTMLEGIPGTSMPAFRMLPESELDLIIEYVRWMTMRGEYENMLAVTAAGQFELTRKAFEERIASGDTREDLLEEVQEYLELDLPEDPAGEDIAAIWADAEEEDAIVTPDVARVPDSPESRARGRALYLSDRTQCASCHGPYGKGDGPQTVAFTLNVRTNQPNRLPGLYDEWGNPLKPRDLTQGIYRGGRRPIDLYRRIHAGIKGTPMPAFGGSLTDEEIWDMVNFLLHVPYDPLPEPGAGSVVVSSGH